MSHQVYNVIHIIGIILLMSALGGAAVRVMTGGTDAPGTRRLLAALHGTGALFVLVGGFGMLARLGFMHGGSFPGWLWVKLVIWGLLAVAPLIPRRRPAWARPLLLSLPLLGGIAAYMAIYKPF